MQKTTIQVSVETLNRLKSVKRHVRESYDEVLNYLIDEAEEDELTSEEIDDIKKALENVKKGKVKPIEQVAKELGIRLT
jgi:macrodomain Ter protein organizer (MatP/YcbG family)